MQDAWQNCYDDGWKGLIVDAAFAHPAKIARGLARRIFQHADEQGWLDGRPIVCDPFGGIGGTAYYAAHAGIRWIGCELEPKFHDLARQNFAMWMHQSRYDDNFCVPEMLLGDSRRLCELVAVASCVVSSPPFIQEGGADIRPRGGIKRMDPAHTTTAGSSMSSYGTAPGQLGAMREGDVDAVVSSPPYVSGGHHTDVMGAWNANGGGHGVKKEQAGYGKTPAQLGLLREGDVAAVVSSPPYDGNQKSDYLMSENGKTRERDLKRGYRQGEGCFRGSEGAYGQTSGQLGIEQAENFWTAARQIVEQSYRLLRPGGHAIWVVKDYVKSGKIVPFCDNWRRLCEAVGFTTVCQHRAMLVKDLGIEHSLFEAPKQRTKERKSFFRRLAEKKGSPRIDWEMAICMVKPESPNA